MEASSSAIESRKLPELPEELIIEILLRLPLKSLGRFKLVSKTWHDFLKSPTFICMHHKFSLATVSRLLVCTSYRSEEGITALINNHVFSFGSNGKTTSVLSPDLRILGNRYGPVNVGGCCNGIVCYYHDTSEIFLQNPATGELRQLPPTSFQPDLTFYQGKVAFGFDSTNIYDFKVLRLFVAFTKKGNPKPTNKAFRAEIYTLSSNTWRQLHWNLDDSLLQYCTDQGLFCANSFHFIMQRCKSLKNTIVCFDIHKEKFKTMELPLIGERYFNSFITFKEFLSVVCTYPEMNCEEKFTEIWIMKDYGVVESWTKLYKIGPPWGWSIAIPLCFCMEEDVLLLKQRDTKKLVSCHLKTLNFEGIEIDGYKPYSQVVVYKETLVSIM